MDKNMLAGLDGLPEQDKARMAAMIDHLQLRDSLRMYNSLVERCFNDCVDNFTRKTLQKQEETCVMRCAEKFLKHSMRRWHEVCRTQFTSSYTRIVSPDDH